MSLLSRDNGPPLRVLVVTPLGEGGAGGIDRVVDQLRVVDVQRPNVRLRFAVSRGANILGSLYNLPFAAAQIVIGALTRQVDVVHLNLASNSSAYRKFLLSCACRTVGLPYVIHLHGGGFDKFWWALPPAGKRAIDSFFRHAGAIIVLGETSRDMVVGHLPEVAESIFIVPNATQRRSKATGSGPTPNVLFLGRLGKNKGVPDLLQALARLPAGVACTATLAGDGDVEVTMQQARALGLSERVSIPGWVGPGEVERLIDKADILVLPSYEENLPMSVIEGMAAGLAVIATPVGATEDVIKHEVTGLLVTPGHIAGIQSALERLLRDANLREKLGRAAQEFHHERLDVAGYIDRLSRPWSYAATRHPAERQPSKTRPASGH